MNVERQIRFWLIGLAIMLLALYLLRGVLLPFVAGMAVAYLLDPICDRLEKWGLSRTLATTVLTILFLLLVAVALMLLVPMIVGQLANLVERTPGFAKALREQIASLLAVVESRVDPALMERIQGAFADSANRLFTWVTDMVAGVLSGGAAVANTLSLIVITPVVTFYLLRDWDRLAMTVDSWLPRAQAPVIRELAGEVDKTLAGFLRGQGTVCLLLGVFYAIALSVAGLEFGLIIGLIAGLLSFIPYVGSVIGLLLSVGLAFLQFDDWVRVAAVAAIFFVGQVLEGNFLTPRLVGGRVGLHPVWVIFAILAGGTLFGFVGVLLAVPVAAVVGVGTRFALNRYLDSPYYNAGGDGGSSGGSPGGSSE
jgi:predicted PurR-regulated permease PerM